MAQNGTLTIRAALEGRRTIWREIEIEASGSLYTPAMKKSGNDKRLYESHCTPAADSTRDFQRHLVLQNNLCVIS